MGGSTQISVFILAGVCLSAIPMAAAVKSLERMLANSRASQAIAELSGNMPTGESNDDILPYIVPQKVTRALKFILAAGVLTLTWTAFGCLVAVLVITL